jgi:tetratricopeptide (TPR) repeat protein
MSRTLNLVDRLLTIARHLQKLGREQDALELLHRLAGFCELPDQTAEEIQLRLGEIFLKRRKYSRARRHLAAALLFDPDNPRYHSLLADALNSGDKRDPDRAAEHYRRSLELDPRQPHCLGNYGVAAIRLGESETGLACLRRAVELFPDDLDALSRLVEGLRLEGQLDEARTVLRAALFRNPRCLRVRKMWTDFLFQQLHAQQEEARKSAAARRAQEEGPTLLPFVPPVPGTSPLRLGRKRIRRDPPAPIRPPHLPRPVHLPEQKHAQ